MATQGAARGFPCAGSDSHWALYGSGLLCARAPTHLEKSWLLVGRDEDFGGVGHVRTFDRTVSPLLLVRGHDEVLRAFFNTCQHRGAPVVRDACGAARRLRCQYHSWTYDLDGTLVAVLDRRDFTNLDESKRSLKPVRCEVYDGWVFVNEDPAAPPLRE